MSTPSWPGSQGSNPSGSDGTSQPGGPAGYPPPDPAGYVQQPGAGGYPPPGGQPVYGAPGYGAPQPTGAYPPPPGAVPPGSLPPGAVPPGSVPTPPPATPKSKRPLIVAIVLVVVIAGIGGFVYYKTKTTNTAQAGVGSCIQVKSVSVVDADTAQIDCADPQAFYIVTETGSGDLTCDSAEAKYTQTSGSDTETTVCMRPNLKAGDCWKEAALGGSSAKYNCAAVPADAKASTYQVLKVDLTTSDDSACPADSVASLSDTKRNVVYCFGDLK